MKAVWLLLASILCVTVWMDDLTSAEMASTRGHFIKTGPGYRDTVPKGALTDSLINSANIVTGDSNSPIAALECGRKCLETAGCLSVAIKPSNHTCFLTSLDKCQAKKSIMDKAPGYNYYDILPGDTNSSSATCFETCVAEGGCDKCGRLNCIGETCTTCAHFCWETPTPREGWTFLWSYSLSSYNAFCSSQWQLVMDGQDKKINPPNTALQMRLEILYSNKHKDNINSYFKGVSMNGKRLTVGEYLSGEAGNWWEAPFDQRPLTDFMNSTCRIFYYSNMTSCNANGIDSYEEQMLNTSFSKLERGYAWYTGDSVLDAKKIIKIRIWMQPE